MKQIPIARIAKQDKNSAVPWIKQRHDKIRIKPICSQSPVFHPPPLIEHKGIRNAKTNKPQRKDKIHSKIPQKEQLVKNSSDMPPALYKHAYIPYLTHALTPRNRSSGGKRQTNQQPSWVANKPNAEGATALKAVPLNAEQSWRGGRRCHDDANAESKTMQARGQDASSPPRPIWDSQAEGLPFSRYDRLEKMMVELNWPTTE